ncbi:shikimate kinase [Lentibacillus sp. N15]|uniref:shikimate kinase n=1 Tax=Lentibacillus songyuanensis TaxID=3136161 RepID=UPI0031BB5999
MTIHNINNKEKSIVLTGFMGVGKTTVGKLLANRLNRTFIDIDKEIENEYQKPITKIFKTIGEKAFRQKEKETVIHYAKQGGKIISLGGGAFMQKEIKDACLENCIVIHLDISWKAWKERMSMLVEGRPVLQSKSIEDIEALFSRRRETYLKSHFTLITDDYSEEEVTENIINKLKL